VRAQVTATTAVLSGLIKHRTLPLNGPKFPIDGITALISIAPRNVMTDVVAYITGNTKKHINANVRMNALH
jgi:hypothetical protein